MRIETCNIEGVLIITPVVNRDERGSIHRSLCLAELSTAGVKFEVKQGNISKNARKGTLRGLHYQLPPHREAKVLSCISGSLFNVILDLRADSKSFGSWVSIEVSSRNHRSVFVPEGCANGFLTLADDTTVHYYMSEFFSPSHYLGVRYDDSQFGIRWPLSPVVISERDRNFPDFREP